MEVKVKTREGIWQLAYINPKNYTKIQKRHGKDGIKIIKGGELGPYKV